MSKRSKACDISPKVRQIVYDRDGGCCIICGKQGIPNAHYISRAHGGLGSERNIVTLCPTCHHAFDNGNDERLAMQINMRIEHYLQLHYANWNEKDVIYDKWRVKNEK